MGQRVNIQYSVELDDLGDEVNRLFNRSIRDLQELFPSNEPARYVPMDLAGVDMIEDLRQKISSADAALSDVQNIVQGYIQFKSTPPETEAAAPSQEIYEEEIESPDQVLLERIRKFKEEVPNEHTTEVHPHDNQGSIRD
tara:strand:+ start:714 stop:1133 length:420 start_codon:yes stop_codon:yes gene_type:complete